MVTEYPQLERRNKIKRLLVLGRDHDPAGFVDISDPEIRPNARSSIGETAGALESRRYHKPSSPVDITIFAPEAYPGKVLGEAIDIAKTRGDDHLSRGVNKSPSLAVSVAYFHGRQPLRETVGMAELGRNYYLTRAINIAQQQAMVGNGKLDNRQVFAEIVGGEVPRRNDESP